MSQGGGDLRQQSNVCKWQYASLLHVQYILWVIMLLLIFAQWLEDKNRIEVAMKMSTNNLISYMATITGKYFQ